MTWSYRLVSFPDEPDAVELTMCEVYVEEDGSLRGFTPGCPSGATLDDLTWDLARMLKAMTLDPIPVTDFYPSRQLTRAEVNAIRAQLP